MSQEKKTTAKKMVAPKLPIVVGCAVLIILVVIGIIAWMARSGSQPSSNGTKPEAAKKEKPVGTEVYPVYEPGTICPANKTFSFQLQTPYSIALESKSGIGVVTNDGILIIVSKSQTPTQTLENMLQQFEVTYKKEGQEYLYEPPQKLEDSYQLPNKAISTTNDNFILSIFYDKSQQKDAQKIFQIVKNSLKGGCK